MASLFSLSMTSLTPANGRMPLVALTAYGRAEDKEQILTAGFDSHAIKPVDPVELSTILETLISSRREMSGA
jgi:CheY-like chemotaxis protein